MSKSFVAPWTIALQAPLSIGFSKNTGVGCRFLLQRIFLTQVLNPCLLHWQESSLPLSHQGSPNSDNFVAVQSLNRVQLFATPWTAARQAPLFFAISWSLLKLMSIESVMPSNHLILCCPLLLLPSIFPSIRVFWKRPLLIRWPKYRSFSFSICPSNLGLTV